MSDWKIPVVCAALVVAGAVTWFGSGSAEALPYRTDWGDALAEARESGKPILIHFGGSW
jgi:hypothetical protein